MWEVRALLGLLERDASELESEKHNGVCAARGRERQLCQSQWACVLPPS